MPKRHLALVTPATVIGTVAPHRPPQRRPNAATRAREYLTDAEVQKLMKAAGDNRNGHRDGTMVLLAYRHGLRPVELVTLRWDAIDFAHGQIHGSNCAPCAASNASRSRPRGSPTRWLAQDGGALGVAAKHGFATHPHMLRHACGFQLANRARRAPCKRISATATSSTPCATLNWRPRASKIYGATRACVFATIDDSQARRR